jgi:hypothetical protein
MSTDGSLAGRAMSLTTMPELAADAEAGERRYFLHGIVREGYDTLLSAHLCGPGRARDLASYAEGSRLLIRNADGTYLEGPISLAIPFIILDEIADRLERARTAPTMDWRRDFQRWVRDVLSPRYRALRADGPHL